MALDPQTAALLQMMAENADPDAPALHEMSPEEARAFSASLGELAGPAPPMTRMEDHTVSVPDGEFQVRVLVPIEPPAGLIVYFHGGGWVIGSIDETDTLVRKLAERTSCAVVNVDYRLAPEHRYPTAVDDCYAALEWAAAHVVDICGGDAPIFVAGDSAGGNLAAVTAVRARDRGGPEIALQILIYPVTDADFKRPSYMDAENQLLLTREAMVWFWDHYVPDESRRAEPDCSPLRTPDLTGVAPAVIMTAEHDVLRDEGEAYAEALEAAGVQVDFQRHLRQMHGFIGLLMLPGSERGFQHIVRAVRRRVIQRKVTA